MSYLPMPSMWVYRDGKPVPLAWCSQCHSFHIAGEHTGNRSPWRS